MRTVVIALFVLALLCGSAMAIRTNKAKKTSKSSLAPEQLVLEPNAPTPTPEPIATAKVDTPTPTATTATTADIKETKTKEKSAAKTKTTTAEKDPKSARTPKDLEAASAELRAKHAEARRLNQERAQKAMKIGPERSYSATKGPANAIPHDAPNRRRKLRVKEPLPDYALKAKLMLEAAEANTWPGEPTVQGCTPAECSDWCDACDGAITCENSCFLYSTCRNDCS